MPHCCGLKPGRIFAFSTDSVSDIFDLVAPFVEAADEAMLSALRLFRFSVRYVNADSEFRSLSLEPLIAAEAGEKWDGYGPWLGRVMDKCEERTCFLVLALSFAAKPARAAAASHLIPLLASATLLSGWITCATSPSSRRFTSTVLKAAWRRSWTLLAL